MAEAGAARGRRAVASKPRRAALPDVATTDLYTRAEALRDGCLIDATAMAAEMGITFPVALTHYAWRRTVVLTLAAHAAGQSEASRLRNILAMYRAALLRDPVAHAHILTTHVVTASSTPVPWTLRAAKGAGDRGEAVVTISLFDED